MAANYVLLERITVGAAGASSVTFNNIPQTGYTDLKVVMSARVDAAQYTTENYMQFNYPNTGYNSGYSNRMLYAGGTGVYSTSNSSTSQINWLEENSATSTSNTFGNTEIYIPNYTSSLSLIHI